MRVPSRREAARSSSTRVRQPGGGAPGDGTHLLRAILDADLGGAKAVFGSSTTRSWPTPPIAAGVGATIDVELGGKHDDLHGAPVPITAT